MNGLVLPEHHRLELRTQILQLFPVRGGDADGRDLGHLGHDFFDVPRVDFFPPSSPVEAQIGPGFVDDVDGLVRQVSVIEVFGRETGRGLEGCIRVCDTVVLFVPRAEPLEDLHGLVDGRLGDLDFLETPGKRPVLSKMVLVFLESGRSDAADLPHRQHRLEDVGRVHGPAAGGPGPDDGVDLIDEQNGVGQLFRAPMICLSRCSKSPRNLVPASREPRSSE